jgi:hypothetical protein
MAATITPGHHAVVYASGTAATLTNEATTVVTANTVFQITTAARRVIDPSYAVTTNGTGAVTVNRLTGTLTFATTQTPPITISGKYLPISPVLYCKEFSMDSKPKLVEITPLNQNYQGMTRGLSDVSGTISNFYDPLEVAGLSIPVYFNTEMLADATIAIKLYVHATLSLIAWAVIDKEELKAAIDGVLEQTIDWSGAKDLEGNVFAAL